MKKLALVVSVILFSFMSGCMTTIHVENLPNHPISGIAMPEPEKFQIILTEFKDKHDSKAAHDLAKNIFAGQVNRILRSVGADLVSVNRALGEQLKEEIMRLEQTGQSEYVPPQAANLAIGGAIYKADITTDYRKPYKNKDGETVPGQCTTTAIVEGAISLYNVNPIGHLKDLAFKGRSSKYTEGSCRRPSRTVERDMLKNALDDGLATVDGALKTQVAGRGHVVSARIDPESGKVYYRLSIKPEKGAKPGTKVKFYEIKNHEGIQIESAIGDGKVVCTPLADKLAYAELNDNLQQDAVSKSTMVQLIYTDGFFDSMRDLRSEFRGNAGNSTMGGCQP